MKTYYTLNEVGQIHEYANWKFSEHALETDREIDYGYDGRLYFVGDEPQKSLEEAKAEKLVEISAEYLKFDATGTTMTSLGFPIQVGQSHCTKLDGAIRFAEMGGENEIYITDANDVTHNNVPLETAKRILAEQMGAALAAHSKKQELRVEVARAETVEELDDIEVGF